MKRALRRRIRAILGRVRSTRDAGPEGLAASEEHTPVGPAKPTRDLAVVIPTPPGVRPDVNVPPLGRLLVERRATRPQDVTLAVMQQGEGDERPLGEILVDHGATTAAHVVEALEHQAASARVAAATSVRLDIALLDSVAQLVAELAETRDEIRERIDAAEDATIARFDRLTTELQDAISRALQQRAADGRPEPGS